MPARKYVTYTSTLPVEVMESIHDYAKKNNISKNRVIEAALKSFLDEEKRKAFEEGFKRVAEDREMKDIAEEGMQDYSEQLKNHYPR